MNSKLFTFINKREEIIKGNISIVELVENSIKEITKLEPKIKAFANLSQKNTLELAKESEIRYKENKQLSILDGCPFAVKDMINTSDIPTEMNSSYYSNWLPPVDAACVSALRKAGAILIGKTVTTPFAVGHTNKTRNPHDQKKTPGGSSSGSGAAVGAGILPIALGTQTRGSLIRPASFCGAVGFKPSLNSIHMGGIHPLSPTLDHVGVIGASISDAWAALYLMSQVTGGSTEHKPFTQHKIINKKTNLKKIAIIKFGEWKNVESDIINEFERIIDKIKFSGCEVISINNDSLELSKIEKELIEIIDKDSMDILAYELDWPYTSYPINILDERIVELLDRKKTVSYDKYNMLIKKRNFLIKKINLLKNNFDLFISLSSTGSAPEITESTGSRHFQVPWTYLGFPSISLPLININRMPVGIQILGFKNDDYELAIRANLITEIVNNN